MVLVLILLALIGCTSADTAADAAGAAAVPLPGLRVIDGDTLELDGRRIRLHGIDAPERAQKCGGRAIPRWDCGRAATEALARLARPPVTCSQVGRDRYGRSIAICRSAGRELSAAMVAQGWALAYRRYSRAHIDAEDTARRARRGLWRGAFVAPHDWRRGARLADADAPRRACRVKGNRSARGRIYHLPGSRWYARTRIDPARGERWFCSEADARAAGWRAARR